MMLKLMLIVNVSPINNMVIFELLKTSMYIKIINNADNSTCRH